MAALTSRPLMLILLVSALCFFTRLGAPKLWDRDEPRNARCAWEMWERQDWVVPTFKDELRAHKPILLYWLMMTAYAAFGVNEFAARFWSAALATGTVVLTYSMGRRLFDRHVATWSAVILASTLMLNVAAHAATPDSALIFCTTLAMALFVRALPWPTDHAEAPCAVRPARLGQFAAWTGAGIALGLGVLAKGPVGFVLPVAVWTLFLMLFSAQSPAAAAGDAAPEHPSRQNRLPRGLAPRLRVGHLAKCLGAWHPIWILSVMLVVAAPWYYLVGERTDGAWLREFFLEHNVSRAMQPMEGHSGNAILYYPLAILVGFFPWSALTIPTALWIGGRRCGAQYDPRLGFLLTWAGVYIGAFSLASTKLPSYVTPTYPALALMVGHFVACWPLPSSQGPARWWPRWSAATLIVVGLALVTALPWAASAYLPGEQWLGGVGLILLAGGLACLAAFRHDKLQSGMRRLAITAVCFVVAVFGWVAPRVSSHQQIQQLVAAAHRADPRAPLASWGVHEPSWVYYAGHTVPLLHDDTPQQAREILVQKRGFLITTRQRYERLQRTVSDDATILASVPYFLKRDDLLLIGRVEHVAQRQPAQADR
jgi:4-amino-4-deoxy-L-arabinose transferase-like glycosyltransferase